MDLAMPWPCGLWPSHLNGPSYALALGPCGLWPSHLNGPSYALALGPCGLWPSHLPGPHDLARPQPYVPLAAGPKP